MTNYEVIYETMSQIGVNVYANDVLSAVELADKVDIDELCAFCSGYRTTYWREEDEQRLMVQVRDYDDNGKVVWSGGKLL